MLAMYWGKSRRFVALCCVWRAHIAGYRRRENMRLALANLKASLALTVLLILMSILCAVAWIGLSVFLEAWQELEFMVEAAIGSFGFYVVLLSGGLACCRLVAGYASKIGIVDHLKPGANGD